MLRRCRPHSASRTTGGCPSMSGMSKQTVPSLHRVLPRSLIMGLATKCFKELMRFQYKRHAQFASVNLSFKLGTPICSAVYALASSIASFSEDCAISLPKLLCCNKSTSETTYKTSYSRGLRCKQKATASPNVTRLYSFQVEVETENWGWL